MKSSASAPSLTWKTRLARLCLRSARSVSCASSALSSTSRIATSFGLALSSISLPLRARQSEVEGRAPARFALGPHAPAVAVDDALYDGEADAGPLELLVS